MLFDASLVILPPDELSIMQGERCQNIDRESHKSNCRALARAFRQASEAKRSMWWALDTFWTSYDDLVWASPMIALRAAVH